MGELELCKTEGLGKGGRVGGGEYEILALSFPR